MAKAKVTLVERHRMGGDCLNTGCVPSKALIRTANFVHQVRNAERLGCRGAEVDFDLKEVMARVRRVVQRIEPHDSVERYSGLGVECLSGEARIISPYTVEVGERTLSTRSIVIATGAGPLVPPIPGLAELDYLTSDSVWDLEALPGRLLVLGGGSIGCELAQAFSRLGSRVIQVEMLAHLMSREDSEVSELIEERFRAEGVDVRVGHEAKQFIPGTQPRLLCEFQGEEVTLEFDRVLVALGRKPTSQGLGLEALDIRTTSQGTLEVNEFLQTRFPNVLGCGDIVGPYQFTHVASHQAWFATMNALFGDLHRFKVDYSVIPWATFTAPEVARVGLNENEARNQGIPYEVTRYGIDELDRAIADEVALGFVKVLTAPGRDRILGVTIVGEHAAEHIVEFISGMRHGFGLKRILSTIHIYPTHAEANKYAAGEWRRAHAPAGLLRWVERYHAYRRS
jgi:pyruvate/2-oxoglutarate dehydrogenase complex dihydrolipoamide dehydrogenase (E3) component